MSGHVNMMDDVLISQLPVSLLRSSLRALISRGSSMQRLFVTHVREQLKETLSQPYPKPTALFPSNQAVSPLALQYLSSVRCLFASKLVVDSLPYFTYFVRSISNADVRWTPDSPLEAMFEKASGDIVQAIQALKESRPEATAELRSLIVDLASSLVGCEHYCTSYALTHPFDRAQYQVDDVLALLYHDFRGCHSRESPHKFLHVNINDAASTSVERFRLGPLNLPRLFIGLWQLSSPAWGSACSRKQDNALIELVQSGLYAADMADHYGDAELIFGSFRHRFVGESCPRMVAATKWCVFRPLESGGTRGIVLAAVQERCRRLNGRVELLQFHWYNYDDKQYLEVLRELVALTKTRPDLVSSIGLCNFDAEHTQEACEYLLGKTGEVGVVSNQVQYSLIDSRPMWKMAGVCHKYNIKLLTYGSFCGGFLSDRWLNKPFPDVYSEALALTPSQRKYFDMIMTWGNWNDLQKLLQTLRVIADKHRVGISSVAARWVLERPAVGAVIVGTRLGISSNVQDNLKIFSFSLTDEDLQKISCVATMDKARSVWSRVGDCGHEYRDMY